MKFHLMSAEINSLKQFLSESEICIFMNSKMRLSFCKLSLEFRNYSNDQMLCIFWERLLIKEDPSETRALKPVLQPSTDINTHKDALDPALE